MLLCSVFLLCVCVCVRARARVRVRVCDVEGGGEAHQVTRAEGKSLPGFPHGPHGHRHQSQEV